MKWICVLLQAIFITFSSCVPLKSITPSECLHIDNIPHIPSSFLDRENSFEPLPVRHVQCDQWKFEWKTINHCDPGRYRCISYYLSGTYLEWKNINGEEYPSSPDHFENVFVTVGKPIYNSTANQYSNESSIERLPTNAVALKDINFEYEYEDNFMCTGYRKVNITAGGICYRESIFTKDPSGEMDLEQLQATCGSLKIKTGQYRTKAECARLNQCENIELRFLYSTKCMPPVCYAWLDTSTYASGRRFDMFSTDLSFMVNGTTYSLHKFEMDVSFPGFDKKYKIKNERDQLFEYYRNGVQSPFVLKQLVAECDQIKWFTKNTRGIKPDPEKWDLIETQE